MNTIIRFKDGSRTVYWFGMDFFAIYTRAINCLDQFRQNTYKIDYRIR